MMVTRSQSVVAPFMSTNGVVGVAGGCGRGYGISMNHSCLIKHYSHYLSFGARTGFKT